MAASRVFNTRSTAWSDDFDPHPASSSINASSSSQHVDPHDGKSAKRDLYPSLPSAAELYVPSLPGIGHLAQHPTHPLQMYAGNIPSYPGEGKGGGEGAVGVDATIFFMMAKARRSAGKQRVIFWFNGGPGCSSFDGSLMEVGPFRTISASKSESGKVDLELVEGGWEEFATIVFLDQPPGTGFSYVATNGYLQDLTEASAHLNQFLENFYYIFPELSGLDTYFAGESYAGQYIPYFAKGVLETTQLPNFHLSGIAIGNGWIDPYAQYPTFADFAYDKKLIVKGSAAAEKLEEEVTRCNQALDGFKAKKETPINVAECEGVMQAVMAPYEVEANGQRTCMNLYDIRLVDDWPACGMNWPPDLSDVYSFLRRPDVVTALHATKKDTAWVECDGKVGHELRNDRSPASVTVLPQILEAGVPVLLFAGAEDLICNAWGVRKVCDTLKWDGLLGMGNSTTDSWAINGTQVGTWRTHRNLTYAELFGASHMAGFDVPHVTNDMMLRFMDVDFSLIPGIAAGSESKVGKVDRVHLGIADDKPGGVPILKGGNSGKEAAYNIGSAFLILFLLLSIVGFYFYYRRQKAKGGYNGGGYKRSSRKGKGRARGSVGLPLDGDERDQDDAERVPLGSMNRQDDFHAPLGGRGSQHGKGKGKERDQSRYEDQDVETGNGRHHASGSASGQQVFALGDEDEDDEHVKR